MAQVDAVQIVESFWAIEFTGTAVWAVDADGKLLHNWVERSAWEI